LEQRERQKAPRMASTFLCPQPFSIRRLGGRNDLKEDRVEGPGVHDWMWRKSWPHRV
jgi:hypothetical protein